MNLMSPRNTLRYHLSLFIDMLNIDMLTNAINLNFQVGKRLIVNGQPIYTVDMLTAVGQQFISADIASKRSVNITRNEKQNHENLQEG